MISTYFEEVGLRLRASVVVADISIDFREFSTQEGMLRGRLLLIEGSVLEFMEYVQKETRLKYRFHLMDKQGVILFRYDNAHHHNISTFPHHKHTSSGIVESSEKSLIDVLDEVEMLILDASV